MGINIRIVDFKMTIRSSSVADHNAVVLSPDCISESPGAFKYVDAQPHDLIFQSLDLSFYTF